VIVSPGRDISAALPEGTETVEQPEANGTGGALRAAQELVESSERVVVLSGDVPLVSADVIRELLEAHSSAGAAATVMTTELDDPGSYGRVIRDSNGDLERIVEAKTEGDATPEELEIREINSGIYVFEAAPLASALGRITNDNAQGEYYLGDVLPLMRGEGLRVTAHLTTDQAVNLGVNSRADLALVEAEARRRILNEHMVAGVTIIDPASTWIDAGIEIAPDTTILPGTSLRGATTIGTGSVIGPHSTLIDSTISERVEVIHSYLTDCEVLDDCTIGPFAYLRPGARLREGAKAGTFVEIKNSDVGAGAKVPHLSYVGDADIGEDANLGAGTITANYDGFRKHRTKIGPGARIGVDTMLIAPVEVGDGAYTGGGSVIEKDVPPGALGISRAEQQNIDGFADRKADKEEGS
jgi:bifunctional UDP-N-acetylglucosamine pyrophosphorylase/glucosamine-1-phosphate N-acetyltransferase